MSKINEKELSELFIEFKNNNKIAFERLYSQYNRLVYRIAFGIIKNNTDAEDIVQTVFTKIYVMDKEQLPTKNQASWLYSLTKNETITFLRKKNNDIDLSSIYEIEDANNEINTIIDQIEVNRLISKLNDKEKEVVSLKILSNLSFEEIGKLLDLPTGTVKWRYYKSIHTLKILLSNLGMFIITFVVGLRMLFNKKEANRAEQEIIEDNYFEQNNEIAEDETTKSEIQESLRDEIYNDTNELENVGINEEVGIPEQPNTEQINYYGVGILTISSIFLILTITFLIFFVKHQLKSKKKTSK